MNPMQEKGKSFVFRFEKTGPIRLISHLDLTRTFHRAFARAGIPLKFSEGFHPHPKFAFALPLSVGTESRCEWAAFSLKEGEDPDPAELCRRLQEELPAGLTVTRMIPATARFSQIAWASYRIELPPVGAEKLALAEKILLSGCVLKKKNKKGKWVEKDVTPGIGSLSFSGDPSKTVITALLRAGGEDYLKPEALLQVLSEAIPDWDLKKKRIFREEVFFEDRTPFC